MKVLDATKAAEIKKALAEDCVKQGLALLNHGRLKNSIAEFSKAIQFDSDNTLAFMYRGIAYSNLNQNDKAIEDYNAAIEIDPDHVEAYHHRSIAFTKLGNMDAAKKDYIESVQPTDLTNLLNQTFDLNMKGCSPAFG